MAVQWRGEGGQHQGARPYQEDSWAVQSLADGSLVAVIADGMGGHAGGAVASKLVVEAFLAAMREGRPLAEGLQQANAAVRNGAAGDAELTGMGATLVAVTVREDHVSWISVGDSPLYLVVENKLERLNADHSLAPQIDAMVGRGLITAEEAANHPGRHTLREAVMGDPISLVDEGNRKLAQGATLLLCSDGVESLDHAMIAAQAGQPVRTLLGAVLAVGRPHQDNVTVIKVERRK
jgi:PPM family protein phosphatase